MQSQSSFLGQAGSTVSNVKVSVFCASGLAGEKQHIGAVIPKTAFALAFF